jgi:hypothetical protein
MKFFRKNTDDSKAELTNPLKLAYAALPKEKKEELEGLQQVEYKKVFDAEILVGEPQEHAKAFADVAVEELIKKYLDEYAKQAQPPPPAAAPTPVIINPENKVAKTKFTFGFEIYKGGVLNRSVEISVLNDYENFALAIATDALRENIETDETIRYTQKFKKQAVTVEEV